MELSPEECRVPVRRRTLLLTSAGPILALAIITVSCLVIGGVYSISQSLYENSDPATAPGSATSSSLTTSEEDSSTLEEWDSIQVDIDAFENDLIPSEVDTLQLWPSSSKAEPPDP